MSINIRNKSIKAFTLVELMIVLAIIGIVVVLSMFGLQKSREGARDAKRKTDLESLRSALELYKADFGGYPTSGGTNTYVPFSGTQTVTKELIGTGVTNNSTSYISAIPTDPRNNDTSIYCAPPDSPNYRYEYASDKSKYTIRARMENQSASKCIDWSTCLKINWPTCYMVTQP